jgi:hypothetical protein
MAFRRASAVVGALVLIATCSTASFAQDKNKLSKEEQAHFDAVHALVDAVAAGKQPAPSDVKVTFQPQFFKSVDDIYIPYTLRMTGQFATYPVVMYVRAQSKAGAVAPPDATKGKGDAKKPSEYAFEDVVFLTDAKDAVSRALELKPGDYDVTFAFMERPAKDKKAAPAKAAVSVQPLSVPNLLSGFNTSSIMLIKSIEPAGAQLTGREQLEQPYTMAGYKITPLSGSGFSKTGELLWVFYVYNEGAAANGKPDVLVEYNFFRAGEDKPFVNMPSTAYNATTVPAEFNLAAGHMVFVAQGVPLTTFNPGEYKLQIKVTDKTSNQTLMRDVPFTVTP